MVVPAFNRWSVEAHQIGIAAKGEIFKTGVAGVEEVDLAGEVLAVCGWVVCIRAEDPVCLVNVGEVEGEVLDGLVGEADRVEGLFVLAPADVSNEGGIVVDDALTANFYDGFVAGVLEIELVELVGLGIGNCGVCGVEWSDSESAAVEIINGGLGELAFDEAAEAVQGGGFKAEALAQGEGVGGVESGGVAEFIACTDVDGGGDPWRGGGCCGGGGFVKSCVGEGAGCGEEEASQRGAEGAVGGGVVFVHEMNYSGVSWWWSVDGIRTRGVW